MIRTIIRPSTCSLPIRRLARSQATAVPREAPTPTAEIDSIIRNSWTKDEIIHRKHFDPTKVQLCTLMNIKTGGCTEDCSYCSQSSRYSTPTTASRLLQNEPVIQAARKAKENGSTRFCMGAAWRDLQGRKSGFNRILEMVAEIRGMGMEVCTTLGMLSPEQARQLKSAGLTAYNHNLDTSREFYPKVITTRSYDERLATIEAVRDAGINVCTGGILGLGESDDDRIGLIWEVANMREHPESFPVNALVPIPGTPLEKNELVPHQTILRTIATARIALPSTIIRLSAGRHRFSEAEQAMCFMAGANAVFTGEKMLTTPCSSWDEDKAMFSRLGLEGMKSFEQSAVREKELPRYPESIAYSSAATNVN
ncbi:Biotin synthetase [Ceratobasidium theobromae]|uniref:biotin synthase n=1 Tax=Ceratobasidium theobromae TaxID=1582974 RepID=A0A5N5QP43_9AGAM|nr:Biotin synthetase [Ceratobasidium theobromae]